MRIVAGLLLFTCLAAGDDTETLVDQLFDASAKKRSKARERLLALKGDALQAILKRIEERQSAKAPVLQIYDVSDLAASDLFWPTTLGRIRKLDVQVRQAKGNVLVVLASKEQHAELAKLLTELRQKLARVVRIEATFVQVGIGARVPSAVKPGEFAKWVEKNDVTVRKLPSLTCHNSQRASISEAEAASFVADFDVGVAQGTFIADPVVDTMTRGLGFDVRPIVTETHVTLHMDVSFGTVQEPIAQAEIGAGAKPLKIQTPESRSVRVRTSRRVAPGHATVVDLGQGKILVVSAETIRLADPVDSQK